MGKKREIVPGIRCQQCDGPDVARVTDAHGERFECLNPQCGVRFALKTPAEPAVLSNEE